MYNQAVHKQGRQHAQISQLRGVSELTLLLHKLQVCCPPGTYSASTALHDVLDTHYSTSVLALAAHLGEDHCRMKYHESATRVDVPVAYATCRCTACHALLVRGSRVLTCLLVCYLACFLLVLLIACLGLGHLVHPMPD